MVTLSIILTGCNGRLGRGVGDLLCAKGHRVVGVDAAAAPGRAHAVVIEDLRVPSAIHRAFDRLGAVPDAVVHLANHTNAQAAPPEVVLRENLAMNTSVFMAAAQAGVGRVVFSSSIQAFVANYEVDGSMSTRRPHRLPLSEALEPRPSNAYGLSKVLSERMLDGLCDGASIKFHGREGSALSAASVRLPYILTQQQFEGAAKNTAMIDYRWGGPEAFAYIHVDDAASAILAACTAPFSGHEVFWVSAPDPRVAQSVEAIVAQHYEGVPGAADAVRLGRLSDCSKAERVLGWKAVNRVTAERERAGFRPA